MEVEAVDAVGAGGENGGEETFEAGDVAEGNRDRFVDSVVVDEVAFVRVSFLVDRADFDEVGLDVGGGDGFGGRSFEDGGDDVSRTMAPGSVIDSGLPFRPLFL